MSRSRPATRVSGAIDFTLRMKTLKERCVQNFTKDFYLDDVALKALDEHLALLNVKDATLQQLFDF